MYSYILYILPVNNKKMTYGTYSILFPFHSPLYFGINDQKYIWFLMYLNINNQGNHCFPSLKIFYLDTMCVFSKTEPTRIIPL